MNAHEAKKDAAARLRAASIPYAKLTGVTVGWPYRVAVVTIHGAGTDNWKKAFHDLPKIGRGHYIVRGAV